MTTLRIGTRKSKLALWQAHYVKEKLEKQFYDLTLSIVPIVTLGDRVTDSPLSKLGSTSVFTKEIERALLNDQCDIAVHSLKDMATVLPEGLHIGAYLEREDPRDVFVSLNNSSIDAMSAESFIGTSSLRRTAILKHLYPALKVVSIRGNVPTRINLVGKPLKDNPSNNPSNILHGAILSAAGIKRLQLENNISQYFDPHRFVPAPGQGIVAIQTRKSDDTTNSIIAKLNNFASEQMAIAERTFLNRVEGGCQLPISALATIKDNNILLHGVVYSPNGAQKIELKKNGSTAKELGESLAQEVLRMGAREILEEVKTSFQK